MKCPNCQKEVEQTEGKRPKVFCNSTCRSNFWQKAKRKENASVVQNKTQGGTKIQKTYNPSKKATAPKNEEKQQNRAAQPNMSYLQALRNKKLGL